MVSTSADNANAYPVALVPASKSIDNVDAVAGVEVVNSALTVDAPYLPIALATCTSGTRRKSPRDQPSCTTHDNAGQPSPKRATCRDRDLIGYVPRPA
jgi:hypothetical protein